MTVLGICTSTEGTDNAQDIIGLGARVSRFVLTSERPWLPRWHTALGQKVHGVVARETATSYGIYEEWTSDFLTLAQKIRAAHEPDLAYLEVGNEPDQGGWEMPPERFSRLLGAFDMVFHDGAHSGVQLISGGLNSGQPSYVAQIPFPPCMLLGLHAYDKSIQGWPHPEFGWGPLADYLDVYKPTYVAMRGVALTEWGMTDDSEPHASEYVRRMLAYLQTRPEVKLAEYFCLNDIQHMGARHGLIRTNGMRKPVYETYREEVHAMATTEELLKRIEDIEERLSLTIDLHARELKGEWDEGAGSAEALLRTLSPVKYKDFEAVPFPKR